MSRRNTRTSVSSQVRTEDIGNKLTGNIGNRLNRGNALEKRVSDGTKTTIYQFGAERTFYGDRAMRRVWDHAEDRAQMAWAVCGRRNGGIGGAESSAAKRDETDISGG